MWSFICIKRTANGNTDSEQFNARILIQRIEFKQLQLCFVELYLNCRKANQFNAKCISSLRLYFDCIIRMDKPTISGKFIAGNILKAGCV